MFDVDEIKSGFLRDFCGGDEVPDDLFHFLIGNDVCLGIVEFFVEQRMCISRFGFQNVRFVRVGIASGMGQLNTDVQIVVASEFFPVDTAHFRDDMAESLFGVRSDQQLLRIAPAGVHDGSGFGPVKEFCPAPGEPEPAAHGEFARSAVVHAVPPLHGEDCPTVADSAPFVPDRLGESGGTVGFDFRRNADVEVFAFYILRELFRRFEFRNFAVCHSFSPVFRIGFLFSNER